MREPKREVQRVDPPTCGCTDCLTGYSVPLDSARQDDLLRLVLGLARNATGHGIEEFTIFIKPPVRVRFND